MAQPSIKKEALDYGDTPGKVVVLDADDRLPDADASLLRNIPGSKIIGSLTNATISGSAVSGELTNATIDGSQVVGTVANATNASSVNWSNINNTPTTLAGYGLSVGTNLTDPVDVQTFYNMAYLNMEPKIGKTGSTNKIPVVTVSGLTMTYGPQDVFLAGIWTQYPGGVVSFPTNATSYVYLSRNPVDPRILDVTVSPTLNNNTFSTIRIATVTTSSVVNGYLMEAVDDNTINWENVRNRPFSPGEIGTYVIAARNVAGNVARGSTVAGSTLVTTSGVSSDGGASATMPTSGGLTGTWRCMGTYTYSVGSTLGATLWMRIS